MDLGQDPFADIVAAKPTTEDPFADIVAAKPSGASLLKPKGPKTESTLGMPRQESHGVSMEDTLKGDISDLWTQAKGAYKTFNESPEVRKYGPGLGATIQAARGYMNTVPRLGQGILKGVAGGVEALTGEPLDNDTLLGRATSPEALSLTQEETIPGKIGAGAGDATMMALEGSAVAGAGALSKMGPALRTMPYFAGKQGLSAYDTAIRAGVSPEDARKYAAAHAGIGAATAGLPLANVFEGSTGTVASAMLKDALAGKVAPEAIKQVGGKVLGTALEAEALNVLNNMAERNIDPSRSLWDHSEYIPMLGQIAGMKLVGSRIESNTATKPVTVAELLEGKPGGPGMLGLPAPIEVGTGAPRERSRITGRAETQLRRGGQADDAIVNQVLKAIDEIPPEVRLELRDHYAAQNARQGIPMMERVSGGQIAPRGDVFVVSSMGRATEQANMAQNPAMADTFTTNVPMNGGIPVSIGGDTYGPRTPIGQLENPWTTHYQSYLEAKRATVEPQLRGTIAKLEELQAIRNPSNKVLRQIQVLRESLDALSNPNFALETTTPQPQEITGMPGGPQFRQGVEGRAGDWSRTPLNVERFPGAAVPEIKPLSPEAQRYAPLLDSLNKSFYDSYAQLAKMRGKEPAAFNPWHITRLVTEGVEPPNQTTAGASPMKSTSGSQHSRSMFAYREVGNPNGEVFISEDAGPETVLKGKRFVRTEATPNEIEASTGLKYSQDLFAAILEGHRDTNRAIRSRDFRAKLAQSDLSAPVDQAPEGWKLPSRAALDAMPEFEGRAVSPLLSNYLDNLVVGPAKMTRVEKGVDAIRRVLTGSIFANPTAHFWNQATHFLGAYGAGDFLKGNFVKDVDWAMRQINDLHAGRVNPEVKAYLEGGMSTMSKPETADSGATAVNLANAVGRVAPSSGGAEVTGAMGALNRMNRDYTWKLDDALRLALFRKYQRDMPNASPRQISDEVSSFFPDYQRSSMEPYGGMVHGKTAKNTLMFNTYGSQALEATANTAKQILKSPKKAAAEIGGLGLAYGLGKAATKIYRGLTQDEETEVRGGGTLHILDKLYHAGTGGAGNSAKELSGLVHFNPIVKGLLSAGFQVVDPSFGQKVGENMEDAALYRRYLKDGNYAQAAEVYAKMSGDFGQSVADSMLPFSKEIRSLKKGETVPDTLVKMLMAGRRVKDDATDIMLGNVLSKAYSPYPTPYTDQQKLQAKVKLNELVKASDTNGILEMATKGMISPTQAKTALGRMGGDPTTRLAGLIKQADVMSAVLGYREMDEAQQKALRKDIENKVGLSLRAAKTESDRARAMEAARLIKYDIPMVQPVDYENQ